MRELSLVRVRGSNRLWVALYVCDHDIKAGINAKKPGVHLFGGMWYGRDPRKKTSFGKIIPARGVVIGTVRGIAKLSGRARSKLL